MLAAIGVLLLNVLIALIFGFNYLFDKILKQVIESIIIHHNALLFKATAAKGAETDQNIIS